MSDALRAVPAPSMRATLRRVAAVGPMFALGDGSADSDADGDETCGAASPWRTYEELVDPARTQLAAAIEQIRGQLGGERRVAASMFVLGYTARLLGPVLAGALLDGRLLDPRAVRWRYLPGTGLQLSCPAPAGWQPVAGGTEALTEHLHAILVDQHLSPLVDAVRRDTPLSPRLLWGNVASSAAGALRALALNDGGRLAECHDLAGRLFAHPPLMGAGDLTLRSWGHARQLFFVRHSCCLYYRLPHGGKCGDCVLLDTKTRERQWRQALMR